MVATRRLTAEDLDAMGPELVWPRDRTVSVLRPGQPDLRLKEGDELDGGDAIPGFRLPVAPIFAD
jgi:hypothetical protein